MMSISKNRRGVKMYADQGFGWTLPLALLGFFTTGVISGCVLWRRCFSPAEISSVCSSLSGSEGQTGLLKLLSLAWSVIPVVFVLFVSAFFAFGWICVPAALFSFGLTLGTQLCSIIGTKDILSALPSLASFLIPSAVAVALAVLLGRDCAVASLSLSDNRRDRREAFIKLIVRIPFYLLAVVLYAWIRSLINL